MLGVAVLLLAALFAAAALTNGEPPLILQPTDADTNNLYLSPSNSVPIVYLDGKPEHTQPLKPGAYQTRPDAIILIVPESGQDDCCVVGATDTNSKMPNARPNVQAVPIPPSK